MNSENENHEFPPGEGSPAGGDVPLNTGKPAVASAPGKLIFVIIFAAIFIVIIGRSLFFESKTDVKPVKHTAEKVTSETAKNQNELSITPGSLPQPLPSELSANQSAPPPPPPPPPPPAILTPDAGIHTGAPTNEALNKRIHSPLITSGHGFTGATAAEQSAKHRAAVAATNDPNSAFAQSVSESKAERVEATRLQNLDATIGQGKLIQAILESAINTELPGPIRAITSHDTYAEAGREILIPKGSRLIGSYNSQLKRGQARVFIIWHRVIRPDGVDIQIDSPSVDALGRAGIAGDVDNKYFEVFSSAFLTSALDIGTAAIGDALFGNQQSTTTNNGSGSTTTESPTATAMQTAIQNIGQVGNSVVNSALSLQPTINVDQGTPIAVFVNRDLIFPPEITAHTGFIQ